MSVWSRIVAIALGVALFAGGSSMWLVSSRRGLRSASPAARRLASQLRDADDHEFHHVCVSGNGAPEALDLHLLHATNQTRRSLELKSSLSDHICTVEEAHVGNTLFTIASKVQDRCSARWRAQALTCNIHVHAHTGEDCSDLFKHWLFTDTCETEPIVLHDDPALMRCMAAKIDDFNKMFPGTLDGKCRDIRWVSSRAEDASALVASHIASAVADSKPSMIERHSKISLEAGAGLRERVHVAYASRDRVAIDIQDELLRVFQNLPVDRRMKKLLTRRLAGETVEELAEMHAESSIVIDNGSGVCKVGYGATELPVAKFAAAVGQNKHEIVMADLGGEGEAIQVGDNAIKNRAMLKLSYPIEHGVVSEDGWQDMARIWRYAFHDQLGLKDTTGRNVMLTVAPMNPDSSNIKMASIMFDSFSVGGVYIAIQAVLSLYNSGATTGVVLDSGDGVTHVVPVFEGFGLKQGILRLNLAGRDVTNRFITLLELEGTRMTTSSEKDIAKAMKEDLCYVSMDFEAEMQPGALQPVDYRLPDNKVVKVKTSRIAAPEILFTPSLLSLEDKGVVGMMLQSVQSCDVDVRVELYGNVVLSGGSTLFPFYEKRLERDLKLELPPETKVIIKADENRYYSVWIGGAILSSLESFEKAWFTMQEYENAGKSAAGVLQKMM